MIKDLIGKELLFFDGAMGTLLQEKGLGVGEMPETFNMTNPCIIQQIHESYLDAGANIIKTNTFGANSYKLKDTNYTVDEVIKKAVGIAKKAVLNREKAFVALDMGPTGKLLAPCGDLEFEEAYEMYSQMVRAGADADCILIETISDTYEAKAAILAAKENSNLPVFVTVTLDESGRLLTGGDLSCIVSLLEGLRVDALGFNCGFGPKELFTHMKNFKTNLPIIINPNAGLPVNINGKTSFSMTPSEFAENMKNMIKFGVSFMGGCCGTTPDYIKCLAELCGVESIKRQKKLRNPIVSSYSSSFEISQTPMIIGERLNPTGKKRLKSALIEKDYDFILNEAISQAEKGANVLDINVGLNEINEPEMMLEVVKRVQGVTNIPLQIDTSNIAALEAGLRIYNGKCIVNSVNGKEESMHAVFPLIKKYGGLVVALLLDEKGIPNTAEKRIKIAKKIIKTAKTYSIPKSDILFDPLAMTISTGTDNAKITLNTLKMLKELNLHSVLGVSNISFGLPKRENINSVFFANALSCGLTAGIINPMSDAMMNVYYSHLALFGLDKNFEKYIDNFSDVKNEVTQVKNENVSLFDSVIKGLHDSAAEATCELLKTREPLDIINNELIVALDEVGKSFEEKKTFLPQLLMSADAAKSAFSAIREYMQKKGKVEKTKGKIVLATVKGDIHDIGKNIVKVLLQNYGYEVFDLGKNVESEKIIKTVLENNVRLVGLSALMTTTVDNMEKTINELKMVSDCKIMVGGAVLTEEYAKRIGADFYSKDAMQSVRYAEKFFTN